MAEVGTADSGVEQGGLGCLDLGSNLFCSGSVGHSLQVVDVGHDTAHWEILGRIPPQSGLQAYGEATLERIVRIMDLSPSGGSDGGSGIIGGRYLCIQLPEHILTVYCEQDHLDLCLAVE